MNKHAQSNAYPLSLHSVRSMTNRLLKTKDMRCIQRDVLNAAAARAGCIASIVGLVVLLAGASVPMASAQSQPDPSTPRTAHTVRITDFQVPQANVIDGTTGLPSAYWSQSVSVADGFGRVAQGINVMAGPNGDDFVTVSIYDNLNRNVVEFLPIASSEDDFLKDDLENDLYDSHSGQIGREENRAPYAETIFEASSLERTLEVGASGERYQPGMGYTTRMEYGTNTSVIRARIAQPRGTTQRKVEYPSGYLTKKTVTDPNGQQSLTYTDRSGKVILRESGANGTTYNMYDERGNIRFEISPEGVRKLKGDRGQQNDNWVLTEDVTERFVTEYRYNGYDQAVEIHEPNQAPIYKVYDPLDRVVMEQNGTMRSRDVPEWTFYKYDIHGRKVMQGTFEDPQNRTREEWQDAARQSTSFFEYSGDHARHYTDRAFPQLQNIEHHRITSTSFYDHYQQIPSSFSFRQTFPSSPTTAQQGELHISAYERFDRVRGKMTGSKSLVVGGQATQHHLWSTQYYDRFGRVIQTQTETIEGGRQIVSTRYTTDGRTYIVRTEHQSVDGALTTQKRYTYDQAGRVKRVYHQINSQPEIILAEFEYNRMGEKIVKRLHSTDGGSTFLQAVNYERNERGWLTQVNNVGNLGDDLFAFRLTYEQPVGLWADSRHDGGVSSMEWATPANGRHAFGYQFDQESRLRAARYGRWSGSGWADQDRYSLVNMDYDLNGNILSARRNGVQGEIDNLQYRYEGDQLIDVEERALVTDGQDFTEGRGGHLENTNETSTPLVISRVYYDSHYDDKDNRGEEIVVRNVSSSTINLQGWTLRDISDMSAGQYYTVQSDTISLAPGETQEFSNGDLEPGELDLRGQLSHLLRLSNRSSRTEDDDILVLEDPSGTVIDYVSWNGRYYGGHSWSLSTDGQANKALLRVRVDSDPSPDDWVVSRSNRESYVYDQNGNLVRDHHREMRVYHTRFNQPEEMIFDDGRRITWAWTASGTKLSRRVYDAQDRELDVRIYAGSIRYGPDENGGIRIKEFAHAEGRVRANADGSFTYQYVLSDHLGNARVVFAPDGNGNPRVVQETHYYPYGMRMDGLQTELADGDNDDLYNGKEIVDAHGLNWYHYGMRYYDPILGRWMTTDPAGEYFSPYSYVGGDPVNLVDPDGASSGPPCCDIGYGLNFTLSSRSGGLGFRMSAAVGMRMRTPNVQVSQNLAVNLYNFGVGTREGTIGSLNTQVDIIYSIAATVGGGNQDRLPLHTHSGLTATGVSNDYSLSVSHGQNFVLNSSGRNQTIGSHGIRAADLRLQSYNDVDLFLGDGDDRWWSGGGTLSATTADGPVTVGTEVFTAERVPIANRSDEFYVDGAYYRQRPDDMALNSGRTFIIGASFAYGVTIGRGRIHTYSQDIIHDNMKIPKFKSKAVNK